MRIYPIPPWLKTALSALETVVVNTLIFPFFLMVKLVDLIQEKTWPEPGTWQRWYAWYPVRLGLGWDQPLVWLESVERAVWCDYRFYRRPGDDSVRAPWDDSE